MAGKTVVVVGASPKPDRYSNQAVRLLLKHGHGVVPINPAGGQIEGLPVVGTLDEVAGPVDVVTLYVGPQLSGGLESAILKLRPGRVIFNPGTENPALRDVLAAKGVVTEEACTLVLLNTGQF